MPPIVTAIRDCARSRVQIELDGVPWRDVPLDAAAEARLALGVELDRSRARELNRAIRRHAALSAGVRALRHATHTRASLDRRLAGRGVRDVERARVLDTLERAGLVDDERAAYTRADGLMRRGCGDAMIAADLAERGVADELARSVIAALSAEPVRAAHIVARRGGGAATARYLSARGFPDDVIEATVAGICDHDVG